MKKQSNKYYLQQYEDFKNTVDVVKFTSDYKWNSVEDLIHLYQQPRPIITKLVAELQLTRDNDEFYYLRLIHTNDIDVEALIKEFEQHSITYLAEKYSICAHSIQKILNYNNIPLRTSVEERQLCKTERYDDPNYNNITQGVKTRESKYNSREEYNKHFFDVFKQHKIDEFGSWDAYTESHSEKVSETSKQRTLERKQEVGNNISAGFQKRTQEDNEKTQLKRKNTIIETYGSWDTYVEQMTSAISATVQDKYGVPWSCLRPEAKVKGNNSGPNSAFSKLLSSYCFEYSETHNNNPQHFSREFTIKNKSFDFKIDNTLIEINPTITHNSTFGIHNEGLQKDYHQEKTILAKQHGYRCIHVWDWDSLEKIVNLLLPKVNIYARKCTIEVINDKKVIREFLSKNHLQGNCNGQQICIGLYFNNELVQLMTFGKPRYSKNYEWELLRLCTESGYRIVGGAEKLYKYFVKTYAPHSVISYCDNSKFNGDVYARLGLTLKTYGEPSKHWYNMKTRQHITDNLLRQRGYDQLFNTNYGKGTSNEQLMLESGFVEIYDSGQSTYVCNY